MYSHFSEPNSVNLLRLKLSVDRCKINTMFANFRILSGQPALMLTRDMIAGSFERNNREGFHDFPLKYSECHECIPKLIVPLRCREDRGRQSTGHGPPRSRVTPMRRTPAARQQPEASNDRNPSAIFGNDSVQPCHMNCNSSTSAVRV